MKNEINKYGAEIDSVEKSLKTSIFCTHLIMERYGIVMDECFNALMAFDSQKSFSL